MKYNIGLDPAKGSDLAPVEIPAAEAAVVVAALVCPKCGQSNKFCPSCGGRFCNTEGCESADPYHREECRDQNNVGN